MNDKPYMYKTYNDTYLFLTRINMCDIQKFIREKLESKGPYYATQQQSQSILTDHDHHPYTRWYRSNSVCANLTIATRQAGWRIKHNNCYKPKNIPVISKSKLCFQPPCNTVFPCYNSQPNCQSNEYNEQCIIGMR